MIEMTFTIRTVTKIQSNRSISLVAMYWLSVGLNCLYVFPHKFMVTAYIFYFSYIIFSFGIQFLVLLFQFKVVAVEIFVLVLGQFYYS